MIKSGTIKACAVIQELLRKDVKLPARFSITAVENGWLGQLQPYIAPKLETRKPPIKSRGKSDERLMEELARR